MHNFNTRSFEKQSGSLAPVARQIGFSTNMTRLALLACAVLTPAVSHAGVLFNNFNGQGVGFNPTQAVCQTVMVLEGAGATHVSQISTYHWNGGFGAPPRSISLQSADGIKYGPFPAVSSPYGRPNTTWDAHVNLILPDGAYRVIDGDVFTWSQNAASFGCGFAYVEGEAVPMPSAAPVTTIMNNYNTAGTFCAFGGPPVRTTFTRTTTTEITHLRTYMFHCGLGTVNPGTGTISLLDSNGNLYATVPTLTIPQDLGGGRVVQNATWIANPRIFLPAGTYAITTSFNDGWAFNSGSGFAAVFGR